MIYLTSIKAINPDDGELTEFCGPNIEANSFEDAEMFCKSNGLGYCKVEGNLVEEIKETDFEINLN